MNGLYIHIPFCVKKCAYCDFVSYSGCAEYFDDYISALINEMDLYKGSECDTIFIGGGTPTILSETQLEKISDAVFRNFNIASEYEFTIEANPGTLTASKAKALLSSGVNRISVGVQSLNDDELKAIGRIHDAHAARETIESLYQSGFRNINIDLMTALPSQTPESLIRTLNEAVKLPVTHISAYSLILENGTALERAYSRGEIDIPDDEADREMYAYTVDFLNKNGFGQYEISNFAKKGYECRHNIKYWTFQPYIGLGVAAHSFDGETRSYNTDNLDEYIRGSDKHIITLSKKDKISEFIITGLRMNDGISAAKFCELFGEEIESIYGVELMRFMNERLIKKNRDRYSLTRRGVDVSNSVLCEFV